MRNYTILTWLRFENRNLLDLMQTKTFTLSHSENTLMMLIKEFYQAKVDAITRCETEPDDLHIFSTDIETYYQLKRFLQERNVTDDIILPYVTQFFELLCGHAIDTAIYGQGLSSDAGLGLQE